MDELAFKFTESANIKAIENCTSLEELKVVALQLVQAWSATRLMLAMEMKRQLPPPLSLQCGHRE